MGGAFGYLGGLAGGAAALAPTAGEVAGAMAVTAGATTRLAVGLAGGAASGLARGTGLGAGEHALPASAGQRGRGRAGRPVRQQHERRHVAPALHAALRQQHFRQPRKQPRLLAVWVQAQTNHTPPAAQDARAACLRRATTSWPETSRRPRLSFAVRAKMSVALHVKKHGGSHSRSTG